VADLRSHRRALGADDAEVCTRLAHAVLLIYVARTFLPNAYDLVVSGRPATTEQLVPSDTATVLTRALTILLVAAIVTFVSRAPVLRLGGTPMVLAALIGVEIVSAARSGRTSLLAPLLAVGVVLVAASSRPSPMFAARLAQHCAAPVVLASLLLAVVDPSTAKFGITESLWGSREGRLAGITVQPNTLGAMAGVLVVATVAVRRSRWSAPLMAAGVCALYLSQSYTSWFATIAGVVAIGAGPGLTARTRAIVASLLVAGAPVVGLLAMNLRSAGDLTAVSGRRELWDLVGQLWQDARLLGHGPQVWGELILSGALPPWAVHGHNQLVHSLFVSGLLGTTILTGLLLLLAVSSVRMWLCGHTFAAALLTFQLVRSYSEVPFELFFGGMNVVVLAVLAAALAAPTAAKRPAQSPATAPDREMPCPA
jgi:O-antigen ligase